VVDDAEIGSFSTLMSKFSGGSGSGVYSSSVGYSSSSSPPAPLTYCDLRDNSTGAHVPTANGEDGTCGELLTIGETCEPACHDGYELDGPTTCVEVDGRYVPSRAVCSFAVEFTPTVTLYIDAQVVGHFVHGENNPVTGAVNHAQLAYGDANEMPRLFVARLGENLNTVSFRGTMDELRVWALAVSRSDVAFWKERDIGVYHGSFKGLVAYYDFTHNPTKPTKVGALGYGVNGPVAKSSMTMTLNGAKWTRLEDGRTTSANLPPAPRPPLPPSPPPSPPLPSPPPSGRRPVCPFKCDVGGFVAAPCPCDDSACKQAELVDFHSAPISCVEAMIEYCDFDNGWYYEPEPCWPIRTREIEIQDVGPSGAAFYAHTPMLGDRNVMVDIPEGTFEEDVTVMVTEISHDDLETSIGQTLPTMYAESKSDYLLIRPVSSSLTGAITIRIPFNITLKLGDNTAGFKKEAYQLAYLNETSDDDTVEWVPFDGELAFYARDEAPSDWEYSNLTTRYGDKRLAADDSPAEEYCPSFEYRHVCPDAATVGISPTWEICSPRTKPISIRRCTTAKLQGWRLCTTSRRT
jgi:hypothetical protein